MGLLVGAAILAMTQAVAAQDVACCHDDGACSVGTTGECQDVGGVVVDEPTCDRVICLECCDGLGPSESICRDDIGLGDCKPVPGHTILIGGVCSHGNGEPGVCVQPHRAPVASGAWLYGLGALVALIGARRYLRAS